MWKGVVLVSCSTSGQFGSPSPHQDASLPHVCIDNSLSQPLGTSLPHVYLVPCLNPWATPLPLLHFRARPLATTNSGLPHSISGCVPSLTSQDKSGPIYTHLFKIARAQDKKSLSCFQVVSSRGALEHADSSASEGGHEETKSVPEHDAKTDCKAKRKTA